MQWYFDKYESKITWKPEAFDRKKFIVKTDKWQIDVWEESKK
jgi:hypothetical protein